MSTTSAMSGLPMDEPTKPANPVAPTDPDDRPPFPDVLPTVDVVSRLSDAGMAPETIALSLGAPVVEVKAMLIRRGRTVSPAEQQLAEDVRTLAHQAVKQAARIMQFGPTDLKMQVIRSMLGNTSRLIGTDTGGSGDELRAQLTALFQETRVVPVRETIVTDSEVVDISTLDGKIVDAAVTPQQPMAPSTPPRPPTPPTSSPIPAIPAMSANPTRDELASSLKALLESVNNQDEVAGTAEVQY